MNPETFRQKVLDSDARYNAYLGGATRYELLDIIAERGQTPQVWVTVLDENNNILLGIDVQNWYPNSETGYGEVFPAEYPHTEFNFGIGSRYNPSHSSPPNWIQVFGGKSDIVEVGIPIEHWRWKMVFKRVGDTPAPPPTGYVTAEQVQSMIDSAISNLRIVKG